jgi:adenosine kinase
MASLICGSLAFDTIMLFEGRFKDQILPEQLHILNVSFLVPSLQRDYGGCAGNIAYAVRQLGGVPLPMATLGIDAADYLARLKSLGISDEFVRVVPGAYTAQAMIMTDLDNNQINAFHPGAMSQAQLNHIQARSDIKLGIISPDGSDAMLQHAEQFEHAGIPFIFDPGQQLPRFDGAQLARFVEQASWIAVNDYEGKMLSERTGWGMAAMSKKVRGLIVTLGDAGCEVWVDGERTRIAAFRATAVVDPTGCGDAYRGALLYGLEHGWDLPRCAELGNRVGAIKVAQRGPQNYSLAALATTAT